MLKKISPLFLLLSFFASVLFLSSPLYSQSSGSASTTQTTPQSVTKKFNIPAPQKVLPQIISTPQPKSTLESQEVDITMQALVLIGLSLAPFVTMLLTSFTKIIIVMSLLRNAIGVQQSPPNQVLTGIALILTIYVMAPTGLAMYDASKEVFERKQTSELLSQDSAAFIIELVDKSKEPFRDFLVRNSLPDHRQSFLSLAQKSFPEPFRASLTREHFIVLVPSYISSQIRNAFEIGVLIYLPFFVIDIVTSNVLLAMGMMMMSPMTISLPLKLLLVVMLDAWTMLLQGLVLTYQ